MFSSHQQNRYRHGIINVVGFFFFPLKKEKKLCDLGRICHFVFILLWCLKLAAYIFTESCSVFPSAKDI